MLLTELEGSKCLSNRGGAPLKTAEKKVPCLRSKLLKEAPGGLPRWTENCPPYRIRKWANSGGRPSKEGSSRLAIYTHTHTETPSRSGAGRRALPAHRSQKT